MSEDLSSKRKLDSVLRSPSPERRNRQRFEETGLPSIIETDEILSSTAALSPAYENAHDSVNINDLSAIPPDEPVEDPLLQATLDEIDDYYNEYVLNNTPDTNKTLINQEETMASQTDEANEATTTDSNPNLAKVVRSEAFTHKLQQLVNGSLDAKLIPINNTLAQLQVSIEPIASKLDNLASISTKVDSDHKVLVETAATTKSVVEKCDSHDQELSSLQQQIDDLNQLRRINNLIFSGITESPGENLAMKICEIAAIVNIRINTWDILDALRVGKTQTGNTRPRLVLVKFARYTVKRDLYANRMKLKDPFDRKIFASEDLTERNSRIAYEARVIARAKSYQTWTMNGKVMIRTHLNGETYSIPKLTDLNRFRELPPGNIPRNRNNY